MSSSPAVSRSTLGRSASTRRAVRALPVRDRSRRWSSPSEVTMPATVAKVRSGQPSGIRPSRSAVKCRAFFATSGWPMSSFSASCPRTAMPGTPSGSTTSATVPSASRAALAACGQPRGRSIRGGPGRGAEGAGWGAEYDSVKGTSLPARGSADPMSGREPSGSAGSGRIGQSHVRPSRPLRLSAPTRRTTSPDSSPDGATGTVPERFGTGTVHSSVSRGGHRLAGDATGGSS